VGEGPSAQADRRVFSEGTPSPPAEARRSILRTSTRSFNIGTHNTGADGTLDIFIRGDQGANPINHGHTARTAFDDTWHHVAWVDDDGNARVYIDAVRDPTSFRYIRRS